MNILPISKQLLYQLNKEICVLPLYELDGVPILNPEHCKTTLPVGEQVALLSKTSSMPVEGYLIQDHYGIVYIVNPTHLTNSSINLSKLEAKVKSFVHISNTLREYEQRRIVQYGTKSIKKKTKEDKIQEAISNVYVKNTGILQTITQQKLGDLANILKKIDEQNKKKIIQQTLDEQKAKTLIKNEK